MTRQRHSAAQTTQVGARHARNPVAQLRPLVGSTRPVLALLLLGMLWTLPNTLLGLMVGAAGLPFGARIRWQPRELAWVVGRWPWGKGGAIKRIVDAGEPLPVDSTIALETARRLQIDLENDYVRRIIGKYYGHSTS